VNNWQLGLRSIIFGFELNNNGIETGKKIIFKKCGKESHEFKKYF
jgi:hypothetical protein